MLTPVYIPKEAAAMPDLVEAVREFILAYGLPALGAARVFEARRDKAAVLAATDDHAVITVLGATRLRTNQDEFLATGAADHEPEIYEVRADYDVAVRIDMHAATILGLQRALSLDSVFGSAVGSEFFGSHGLTALYADPIEESAGPDQAQTLRRHSLTLHCGLRAGVDVNTAWFMDATLERVEDVDVHHQP